MWHQHKEKSEKISRTVHAFIQNFLKTV